MDAEQCRLRNASSVSLRRTLSSARVTAKFTTCAAAAILVLAGCSDTTNRPVTGPTTTPSLLVSDGAHEGNGHFYFLSPLASDPPYTGEADGGLTPTVDICDIGPGQPTESATCASAPIAAFSTTAGTGSARVRYDADGEYYIVDWHTGESVSALESGHAYRVTVRVAATPLGYIDLTPLDRGRGAETAGSAVVGFINGRTLPIKFRIEKGAVTVVGAEGGKVEAPEFGLTIEIPPGALSEERGITVSPGGDIPDNVVPPLTPPVRLGPEGVTFQKPVTLTFKYDPTKRPQHSSARGVTVSSLSDTGWVLHTYERPDTVNHTVRALAAHFSVWSTFWSTIHFTTLSVGPSSSTTCALSWGDILFCWGDNSWFKAGDEWPDPCGLDACVMRPREVVHLPFSDGTVVSNFYSSCAIDPADFSVALYCWGQNIGWGTSNVSKGAVVNHPTMVALWCSDMELNCLPGGAYFKTISAGGASLCAMADMPIDGSYPNLMKAYCTGSNYYGQLGTDVSTWTADGWGHIGIDVGQDLPKEFKSISAGGYHVCGLAYDSRAYCWGWNAKGQLGRAPSSVSTPCAEPTRGLSPGPCSSVPLAVSNTLRFTKLSAGLEFTCGLTPEQDIYCWGELFTNVPGATITDGPKLASSGLKFTDVSAGGGFVCATATDAKTYCAGTNGRGQLGTGDYVGSLEFRAVAFDQPLVGIQAYDAHACGIVSNTGRVYCWGDNTLGSLGNGTQTRSNVPVQALMPYEDVPQSSP